MDRRRFLAAGALSAGVLAADTAATAASPSAPPPQPSVRPLPDGALVGWTERTRFTAYGREWRVMEDLRRRDGALAFVTGTGEALVLDKRLEATFSQAAQPYLGLDLATLALADRDLLADRLLASGRDPDPEQVRLAAPPPASDFKPEHLGARLPWTFFVGTRQQADTMPVTTRGATRTYHVEQVFERLSSDPELVNRRYEGLLGGDAPALVKVFPLDERRHYEVVVFADVAARDRFVVQTWHRTSLIEEGRATQVVYAHSYPSYPPTRTAPPAEDFYRALLAFAATWRAELKDMAVAELPDPSWRDMNRHAFVKELMTRPGGDYPKYGAVDRDYYGSEYDGFQDTFTSSLYANLEWGRFEQARAVLDNYFAEFVQDDGMVNMRGAETAQFGLTLALLARYLRYTGDRETLLRHRGKIAGTARILTDLHDAALKLAPSDPGHGLIAGWDESDSALFPDPAIWWRPYFANSAFAARGLKAIAEIWPSLQPGERTLAQDWARRAQVLRARVVETVQASVRHDLDPPYVPPLPGVTETFRESLARLHGDSPQKWPHRTYSELLQADVLPDDLAGLVVDAVRGHGGTTLGVVANVGAPSARRRDILGFISYGYARQLLRLDRIEEYLLFLYSHRFHAHTPGSWTAGEVCDITGGLPLFCIPAQFTIPLLMRWMLVFEEDDAPRLHLARATPRDWLAPGKRVAIQGAPTRWGRVDLSLTAEAHALTGRVALHGAERPEETLLRLRLPEGTTLGEVTVNGVAVTPTGPYGACVSTAARPRSSRSRLATPDSARRDQSRGRRSPAAQTYYTVYDLTTKLEGEGMGVFDGSGAAASRRAVLMGMAAAPAAAAPASRPTPTPAASARISPDEPFVAIQVGARSFVDEGVEGCLDTLRETGGVNVVMAAVFTYGTGLAGRQSRDEPLPDHGVQAYDRIHGGSYAAVHPEFYADSPIKDIRAPDLGAFDILADTIPRARVRGMKTYALFEENYNPKLIPNFEKIAEVDLYGRTGRSTCFNNPGARAFLSSMVSDWVTNNDLDGLMWESERQGPLNNMLGAHFGSVEAKRSTVGCFCDHCIAKARDQGIDAQRAREGFHALDRWVGRTLAGPRVADGTFVSLWRVLLQYPEVLAWERFWATSQEEAYGLIYGTAKAINPRLQVGWHIMHLITMSPFYSADTDYARLAHMADFLKPSPYNNCAGPRLAQYIHNVQSTVFRDSTPDEVLELHYRLMGLSGEPSLQHLPTAGLSGASVGVETRKAIADVEDRIPIYPGIDIDIPTELNEKRTRPEDVEAATAAALEAGAAGVVLSRKYAEMRLTNIAGTKRALQAHAARRKPPVSS